MTNLKVSARLLVFGLLLALSCALPPANAAETLAIGKIIAIRGQATATAGSSRALSLASEIYRGEVVQTDRRCRLQILFADNSIVSLGPASEFVVKDYAWDAEAQQGRMTSRVNEGVFRVLGGSITKTSPQNFTTETPSATIGIRGSMYAGKVRDGQLQVVFQGGKGIYVRNALGSVEIDTPGFGTRLAGADVPPASPFSVPADELEQLDPLTAAPPAIPLSETPPDKGGAPDGAAADAAPLFATAPVTARQPGPQPFAAGIPPAELTALKEQTQQAILDRTTETLALPFQPAGGGTALLSGRFMAVQDDQVLASNLADLFWLGSLNGQTSGGVLNATATTNNGTILIQPLLATPYNPSLPYTGFTKTSLPTYTTPLLGGPKSFSTAKLLMDNRGEFAIFNLRENFNLPTYQYSVLGFLGTPSLSLPTSGISHYRGPMNGTLDSLSPVEFEAIGDSFEMSVNWHNGKLLGGIMVPSGPADKVVGFFIGDLSGTGFTTSLFFGNDITDLGGGPILAVSGSSSFGQFYGNQTQGVGFQFNGSTHNVEFQFVEENWRLAGAGFRAVNNAAATTGSRIWKGFAVGVGEDMAAINLNRRFYYNQTSNDFSLNINSDTGNIAGSFTAVDAADPANVQLNSLQIGGSNPSAYISDRVFAAGIGGGTPVLVNPSSGPLKPQGNYLVTEDPSRQVASYATWGIWEIAYSEPGSGNDYHVHNPGSLWVAGELTSPADFAALNFAATYNGKAEGVFVPTSGPYFNMPTGTVTLNVNFATNMLTGGSLNFPAGNGAPAVSLGMEPAAVVATGFTAPVSTPNFGSVNGAFFGPNAKSVAGNFEAQIVSDRVIGIFAGDRP